MGELRAASNVTGDLRTVGAAFGAGLTITDPYVTAWDAAGDDLAVVLESGRVTGVVARKDLDR